MPNHTLNLYDFIGLLGNRLKEKEVVVSDAGSAFFVVAQALKLKKNARWITSGGFAAMGAALPMAIGCAFARPKQRIICITGDGSLQMNIQELQTIKHYNLPIKLFVLNNEGYFTIRNTQTNFFGRYLGESPKTGISFPDLKKIAWAYGMDYTEFSYYISNNILDDILNSKKAEICEVMINQEKLW